MERVALLHLRAVGVVDAHRAERELDGLGEAQLDLARRRVLRGPARGHGRLQRRVRARGGGSDGEQREGEGERPLHQASPAGASRRRRTMNTARKARISTAASAKIAAVGTPPPAVGVQVSVPVMAPG